MNVIVRGLTRHYRTVAFDRASNAVLLIEQRLLPHEFKIVATKNFRETAAATALADARRARTPLGMPQTTAPRRHPRSFRRRRGRGEGTREPGSRS